VCARSGTGNDGSLGWCWNVGRAGGSEREIGVGEDADEYVIEAVCMMVVAGVANITEWCD
jgi:hypothetical protein